ncbi:diguanylate cyclase [Neiella sp. HB171785]|uniref:Diguanylate cyclase n=1 Tax=Neiella litorisoli TaxID=2771431 RepID=A0A8J6UJR9_9GAMM|nr:diguanylate cyclase [Neiella litorisoli]MBD1391038.1 diguanylate cyclase [Neiella litorisoli]
MKVVTSLLVLALSTLSTAFAAQPLRYNASEAAQERYIIDILSLAVEKSGGNYQLQGTSETYSDSRVREELKTQGIDVYWTMTSSELENEFLPVRIPIFKGLLGNRIFIINADEQHKFTGVYSLRDLAQLQAGQGTLWPDTKILDGAGLPVVTALKYESLFHMLEGNRFDYYPRGVHEPWNEVNQYAALNLAIEQELMLVYRAPMYFFVNRANTELAQALTQGLERAVADGSFDQVFYSSPVIQDVLNKANMAGRRVFHVDNPLLSSATPLDRQELWLDVDSIPRR